MSDATPAALLACPHDRVTWWPHGQECDACGVIVRVKQVGGDVHE